MTTAVGRLVALALIIAAVVIGYVLGGWPIAGLLLVLALIGTGIKFGKQTLFHTRA